MSGPPADHDGPWSQQTRDNWFYGALAASVIAVGVLLLPFANALLFAVTTVVVTWPAHEWVLARTGGRRALAAGLTLILLLLLVFGPLSLLGAWFVQEAVNAVQQGVEVFTSGQVEAMMKEAIWDLELPGEDVWGPWLPEDVDPVEIVLSPLRDGVVTIGQNLGSSLPQLVGSVVGTTLDAAIFLFAVVTLYMEGPAVAEAAMRLSPLRDAYERRLFSVFREFSNNLVAGSLATALVQGTVAATGYAIAGIDKLVFVSILTAVMSFFPIVGTAVVWIPISVYVGTTQGVQWGVFLVLWNAGLTGTVDNIIRPLFLRGSSQIHPLLIFLAVLGGISWLGFPGALVGPVIIAGFLALYTIYCEDFLGVEARSMAPKAAAVKVLEKLGAVDAEPDDLDGRDDPDDGLEA